MTSDSDILEQDDELLRLSTSAASNSFPLAVVAMATPAASAPGFAGF